GAGSGGFGGSGDFGGSGPVSITSRGRVRTLTAKARGLLRPSRTR
ncbi:jg26296, partial [Pararge aegeria aegeria]